MWPKEAWLVTTWKIFELETNFWKSGTSAASKLEFGTLTDFHKSHVKHDKIVENTLKYVVVRVHIYQKSNFKRPFFKL